jgi:hypothetical protein
MNIMGKLGRKRYARHGFTQCLIDRRQGIVVIPLFSYFCEMPRVQYSSMFVVCHDRRAHMSLSDINVGVVKRVASTLLVPTVLYDRVTEPARSCKL